MKINEIIDEGKAGLVGKGLSWLGSKLTGAGTKLGSPAAQQTAQQATGQAAQVVRPSNIPKRQWKQMTPQQRQAVSPTQAPPAGAPSAVTPPSKAAEIQTAKDKLELAKLKAELDAAKGPGLASKALGAAAKRPITTAAAGTMAYHLAGEEDPFSAQGVGSAARKTVGTAANVVKGFIGPGDTATATAPNEPAGAAAMPSDTNTPQQSSGQSDTPQDDAPEPENYLDSVRRGQDERYGQWGREANESIKKKTKLDERDNSAFMAELEKNFPNPMVRNAILARIQYESGGKNVGEMNWSGTSNKQLRSVFPQLRKLPDSELSRIKQNNEQFLNYAYGGKMGNTEPGDGYKYRGRGPIQVTGKNNYAEIDKALGLKGALVKDPDLMLKNPSIAQAATIQFLKNRGADKLQASNQKAAHQALIAMVGGSAYAPNTVLGKTALAKAEKLTPADYNKIAATTGVATPTVASAASSSNSGQGAKPSDKPEEKPQTLAQKLDKMVQPEPRFYKRGELGIDQFKQSAQQELDKLRASAQRLPSGPISQPSVAAAKSVPTDVKDPEFKGTAWTGKTDTGSSAAGGAVPTPDADKTISTPPGDQSAYDKFINAITKGRVPQEEKERIQVPESVNKEIQDILRLSGQKK